MADTKNMLEQKTSSEHYDLLCSTLTRATAVLVAFQPAEIADLELKSLELALVIQSKQLSSSEAEGVSVECLKLGKLLELSRHNLSVIQRTTSIRIPYAFTERNWKTYRWQR